MFSNIAVFPGPCATARSGGHGQSKFPCKGNHVRRAQPNRPPEHHEETHHRTGDTNTTSSACLLGVLYPLSWTSLTKKKSEPVGLLALTLGMRVVLKDFLCLMGSVG
jgi:hypothetical protein